MQSKIHVLENFIVWTLPEKYTTPSHFWKSKLEIVSAKIDCLEAYILYFLFNNALTDLSTYNAKSWLR